jgi:ribulose-phosphate 3-epimerase
MVDVANGFADFVQVDIMDGRFVPSTSISASHLRNVEMHFEWEAHLMVVDPLSHIGDYKDAGASRVIFHIESDDDPSDVIALGRGLGIKVGVALNPDTPVSAVSDVLAEVDSVLLMSVYPGFYGASFVPEVLDKVPALRRERPALELGVDGGIKPDNLLEVARLGFDTVCVGSAIFRDENPAAAYRRLASVAARA